MLEDFDCRVPGSVIVVLSMDETFLRDEAPDYVSYFERVEEMQRLTEELRFDFPATLYAHACFDSWHIVACRDGNVLEWLTISDNCESISGSKGEFAYNGYLPFKGYKLGKRKEEAFNNPEKARKALAAMRADPGLLFAMAPQWETWDGAVHIRRTKVPENETEALERLRLEIAGEFPRDAFELRIETEERRDGISTYRFQVLCGTDLGTKLRDAHAGYSWQPYPLELVSYWRQ